MGEAPVEFSFLQSAEIGLKAPFSLDLPGRELLQAESVLRHLPGRRLVFDAHWHSARVVIKLLFREKDYRRERHGLETLREAGIPCPKLFYCYMDREAETYLLAMEFIEGERGLEERCYGGSREEVIHWLRKAVEAVGKMHRAGLKQEDIHLDNFIISGEDIYVIDGGGIRELGNNTLEKNGSEKARLENLALLFAQLIPDFDRLLADVLPAYGEGAPAQKTLEAEIWRQRERRIRHYEEKCLRDCTEFAVDSAWDHFTVIRREMQKSETARIVKEPEVAIGQSHMIKPGNTSTVVKLEGRSNTWVIKRYNIKDWKHGLSRGWRPTRAWVSWKNAHRLKLLGIHTPKPLALRENRSGKVRHEAYLISEFVGTDHLQAWMLKHSGAPVPEWLSEEITRIFDIFRAARVSHGDMKATNLLVVGTRLMLVDLDAMVVHHSDGSFRQAFRKDIDRFIENWQGATRAHFVKLLQPYLDEAGQADKKE